MAPRKPTRAARPQATGPHVPAAVQGHGIAQSLAHTLGLEGERMGRVDTAWLRMDSDTNLMMIVGVWVLRPGISHAALRQRLQDRLLKYPRFVQRVVEDATGAHWVDDAEFDIDNHLLIEQLPRHAKGREQQALQDRLAGLTMEPLDKRHPLWRFHLIEDYRGGSALLVRIHHCIAEHIAFLGGARHDQCQRFRLHLNASTCHGHAVGRGFAAHVDHVGLALGIKMGECCHGAYFG